MGRTSLARILLALVSAVLALGAVEVALRVADRFPPPAEPAPPPARTYLYRADDDVGYRLWANLDTVYVYPPSRPTTLRIRSNSSGFRGARDFGEADPRPRVLVIGDSFVFGDGVEEEERLTEVLESLEPGWRVENMGMTGWGLDLMLRALERWVSTVQPDVVVLAVYTDDFRRLLPYFAGIGFPYPRFESRGGELVTVERKPLGPLERTRLAQAWIQSRWARERNRYDMNRQLLDRFQENASAHGFALATAFLPGRGDTREDRERREFLRDWATDRDVPHLDLTDPVHGAGVDNTYIDGDFHWNAAGHRIAAEEIHDLLRAAFSDRLPPSPATPQPPPQSR